MSKTPSEVSPNSPHSADSLGSISDFEESVENHGRVNAPSKCRDLGICWFKVDRDITTVMLALIKALKCLLCITCTKNDVNYGRRQKGLCSKGASL